MSQVIDSAYYPLWVSHPVMQIGVVAMIWRHKLLRRYPMFSAYLASGAMLFLVLFFNQKNYDAYFYLYWVGAGLSAVLGFKVIHEVFSDVLRPFHALRDFSSMLVRWAGLMVIAIAILAAMSGVHGGFTRITAGLLSLERSVRVMQCGLILFLLMFSRYLGISRRHRSFGIALGFGIFAAVDLAVFGLRVSAIVDPTTLSLASMIAYDVALAVWLGYFALPAAEQRRAETLLQPQRWDLTLDELAHPMAPESLIPMFDAMVDRAFTKAGAAPKGARPEPPSNGKSAASRPAAAETSSALKEAALAAAHRSS